MLGPLVLSRLVFQIPLSPIEGSTLPAKKSSARKTTRATTSKRSSTKATRRGPKKMAASHKAALAAGREQGAAIRRYLSALDTQRPKRGRKRTPQSIKAQLAKVEERLSAADPLTRVQLHQQRLDLERAREALQGDGVDLRTLEAGFVKAVGPYSRRKGLTYAAWRAAGVDAAVLKKAGIGRA